jgi:hypothetical protein
MTNANKHAITRLREVVKYVKRQWGPGFNRLGEGQQESLIRAEMLAEIYRGTGLGDDATYRELTEAMICIAMQWNFRDTFSTE